MEHPQATWAVGILAEDDRDAVFVTAVQKHKVPSDPQVGVGGSVICRLLWEQLGCPRRHRPCQVSIVNTTRTERKQA